MVRNYDRESTTCSGALPMVRQRSEIAAVLGIDPRQSPLGLAGAGGQTTR